MCDGKGAAAMRTLWKALKVWLLCVAGGGMVCGLFNVVFTLAYPGKTTWPAPRATIDNPLAGVLWFVFVGAVVSLGLFLTMVWKSKMVLPALPPIVFGMIISLLIGFLAGLY